MYQEQTIIDSATGIQAVIALLGILVGWAGGRLTKQIEFRFDLLQRLTTNQHQTRWAILEYRRAIVERNAVGGTREERIQAGLEVQRKLDTAQMSVGEALSYGHLVGEAFPDECNGYVEMANHFMESYRAGDSAEGSRCLRLAQTKWDKFAGTAAKRCGFNPFKRWLQEAKSE